MALTVSIGPGSASNRRLRLGESLAARLARGPLAAREALAIGVQVASAIEVAHKRGVVHRDLKPGGARLRIAVRLVRWTAPRNASGWPRPRRRPGFWDTIREHPNFAEVVRPVWS